MPTVLYIGMDCQCDKLVTDDRHQFITLTVCTYKLTAPETIDAQLRNFLSPEFG